MHRLGNSLGSECRNNFKFKCKSAFLPHPLFPLSAPQASSKKKLC